MANAFVDAMMIATEADQADPARMAELEAKAARSGKMLVHAKAETHDAKVLREHAARMASTDAPTIARNDQRAFLRNVSKIAAGEVKVV